MKRLNFWLARKLLLSKKRVGFISWSGLVSVVGVATGCLALIVSIAVLNGFEREIRQKTIGFETDLRLSPTPGGKTNRKELENRLRQAEYVEGYSFFLERKGIAIAGEARSLVWVKAVEDSLLTGVYRIGNFTPGKVDKNLATAHVGRGIANRLGLGVGDTLLLVNPTDSQVYLGFPPVVKVRVASIYQTNLLNFDDKYCFIPLAVGEQLFKRHGLFDGVDVRLKDSANAERAVASLTPQLPSDVSLKTWRSLHETLFSAMRMEKLGSIVVLSLIILVASFNIASTLLMLVMEKVREIGILRTLGASRERIARIFSFQGLLIGGLGLSLGTISGLLLILVQQHWGVVSLPENIYFIRWLPVLLPWQDILVILLVASVLIGLSVIYPAKVASRLVPREAIQYEK